MLLQSIPLGRRICRPCSHCLHYYIHYPTILLPPCTQSAVAPAFLAPAVPVRVGTTPACTFTNPLTPTLRLPLHMLTLGTPSVHDAAPDACQTAVPPLAPCSTSGACSTCPSSTNTLKGGIERMMMHWIPEVEEVTEVPEPWGWHWQASIVSEAQGDWGMGVSLALASYCTFFPWRCSQS